MRVSRRVSCTWTRPHLLYTACTQVFLGAIETMHTERAQDFAKEGGGLEFDKDDPQALDLVTAASNLRSQVFHIPRKSRWEVKEIAGKIVPAIATTNAIIGGFIVLEALKVRARVLCACRARAARVRRARPAHAHTPAGTGTGATQPCRFPCRLSPCRSSCRFPWVPMPVHYAHAHCTPCTCTCMSRCCAARPPSADTWCATTTRSPGASATGCSTPPPSTRPTPSAASACRRCASWWTRPPSRWATSSMPSSRSVSASAGAPPGPRTAHRAPRRTAPAPGRPSPPRAAVPPALPRPTIYSETLAVDEDGRFRGDQICEGLDPEDDEEEAKCAPPLPPPHTFSPVCSRRCACTRCCRQVTPAQVTPAAAHMAHAARPRPHPPHDTCSARRARPCARHTRSTHSAADAGTRGTAAWR
jgi:hypothetical protein